VKYFFGFLAFLAAAVVVVLLVIGLLRGLDTESVAESSAVNTYTLTDPGAVDTIVRYRITGPVVADENYRELRITASKNSRTIELLKGYGGSIEKSVTYPNTPESYRAFLGALEAAKFAMTKSDYASPNLATTCVTGSKYFYELSSASGKPVDTWRSSCNTNHGNFAGDAENIAELFRVQLPGYNEVASGAPLLGQ
jgi:hypothetical protein